MNNMVYQVYREYLNLSSQKDIGLIMVPLDSDSNVIPYQWKNALGENAIFTLLKYKKDWNQNCVGCMDEIPEWVNLIDKNIVQENRRFLLPSELVLSKEFNGFWEKPYIPLYENGVVVDEAYPGILGVEVSLSNIDFDLIRECQPLLSPVGGSVFSKKYIVAGKNFLKSVGAINCVRFISMRSNLILNSSKNDMEEFLGNLLLDNWLKANSEELMMEYIVDSILNTSGSTVEEHAKMAFSESNS